MLLVKLKQSSWTLPKMDPKSQRMGKYIVTQVLYSLYPSYGFTVVVVVISVVVVPVPLVVVVEGPVVVVGSSPEPDPSNTWLKLLTSMNLAIPPYGRLMLS